MRSQKQGLAVPESKYTSSANQIPRCNDVPPIAPNAPLRRNRETITWNFWCKNKSLLCCLLCHRLVQHSLWRNEPPCINSPSGVSHPVFVAEARFDWPRIISATTTSHTTLPPLPIHSSKFSTCSQSSRDTLLKTKNLSNLFKYAGANQRSQGPAGKPLNILILARDANIITSLPLHVSQSTLTHAHHVAHLHNPRSDSRIPNHPPTSTEVSRAATETWLITAITTPSHTSATAKWHCNTSDPKTKVRVRTECRTDRERHQRNNGEAGATGRVSEAQDTLR